MADALPAQPKDRHPELSAPILDLSLEAQIARAEQRVVDRDARLRRDAVGIAETLRSKRGEAVHWMTIGAGAVALGAIGYAGWRAWQGRTASLRQGAGSFPMTAKSRLGVAAEIGAFARTAVQWAMKLHREQGLVGSLFGMARSALRYRKRASPSAAPSSALIRRPEVADVP